jgi:DNA-binding MarR family transcriptional regulator
MRTAVARYHEYDEEFAIKSRYFTKMLQSVELLHRRFLDVLTVELGRRNKALNSVQALMLSNLSEKPVSLGQLQALGHYEGTNLLYNVTKLVEGGYITLTRPQWDKRSSIIELTAEGDDVAQVITQLLERHAASLGDIGISQADLSLTLRMLNDLNHLWST